MKKTGIINVASAISIFIAKIYFYLLFLRPIDVFSIMGEYKYAIYVVFLVISIVFSFIGYQKENQKMAKATFYIAILFLLFFFLLNLFGGKFEVYIQK